MVEKATGKDADSIFEIEKICFERDAWPRNVVEEEISGGFARRATVVRNGGGQAVAYCISRKTFMNEMEIFKLAVHPLHRRKGFAKLLLKDAFEHLGQGTVTLEVASDNKEAILLYADTGFKTIGERRKYYSGSGRDAILMKLEI